MRVTADLQEILATIHRNQHQIDLLTTNNTQMTNFLLQTGMIQNLRELPSLLAPGQPQMLQTLLLPPMNGNGSDPAPAKRSYRRLAKSITGDVVEASTASTKASRTSKAQKDSWTPERRAAQSKRMKQRYAKKVAGFPCTKCKTVYKTLVLKRRHDRMIHNIYLRPRPEKTKTAAVATAAA